MTSVPLVFLRATVKYSQRAVAYLMATAPRCGMAGKYVNSSPPSPLSNTKHSLVMVSRSNPLSLTTPMILSRPRNTTQWNLSGTTTFRLSSSAWFDKGTNLQNPSPNVIDIYKPEDGYCFVQRDQSGAEALIVAYETGGGNLLRLFQVGVKPHVFVAMHRFAAYWREFLQIDISVYLASSIDDLPKLPRWKELAEAIKSDERKYHIGKMLCHASNYGMEANTFKTNVLEQTDGQLVLTTKEAAELLASYHELFPELRRWHERVKEELRRTRTLRNLFGYPRYFTKAWCDKFVKEAIAFVPQSTVGTITNLALTELQADIERNKRNWHIFNNKHDSYAAMVPLDETAEAVKVMGVYLERDLVSSLGVAFKMRSEAQVGMNWAKYHKEHNPLGMKEVK